MDRLKKFFINGFLMTVVTIIIRYVSVNFNIYISNKIGAVSMGLFTLISSVYGFALTLATSGISLATTKLVSEALGTGAKKKDFNTDATVASIMKKSIFFSFIISFFVTVGLLIFAKPIGVRILGDIRTVSSLKILAFSLPPIAVSSSLSGYFIALRRVHKNAIVQILSQGARIYFCVMLLGSAISNDMESACVAIVLGGTASELLSFGFHLILYLSSRARDRKNSQNQEFPADKQFSRRLLPITLPVAFSAYMRSALVTVEHLLIPWGLQRSGSSRDYSLAAYGTVHSVVFPLVLFPSAISSSFAGLLIPEISESDAMGDKKRIERIIARVLKTVLIYSIGTAAIMMCLSGELGSVLFPKSDATKYIALVSPLIPIMYLDTSVDSILKGLGYQFYSMIINIVDASLSVILVWILLPRFGIMGYIITVYFTEIVNATLSITKLLIVTKTKVRFFDWIFKPIFCSILATAMARYVLSFTHSIAHSRYELFLHIALIALIYLICLILCRAISPKKITKSIKDFLNSEKSIAKKSG